MSDCRATLQPLFLAAACALAFLVFPLLAPWAPPAVATEPDTSQEVIDRIQRECLRAYTPEMLTAMTSGAMDDLPVAVEAAPSTQEEVLDEVLDLDKGPFYPILLEDLVPAFEQYVTPGVRFLDLGSGDGRVVFLANVLGADATGIEYDKALAKVSLRALRALNGLVDGERAHVLRRDFFTVSWSGYDVIFYYDTGSFEQHRLRKKIAAELDPEARLLVAYERIPFPGLALETTFENIHVYRQPEVSIHYPSVKKRCWGEIIEFHQLSQAWRNGTHEGTDEDFARLADAIAKSFVFVGPDGRITERATFLEHLRQAHGSWREPGSDRPGIGTIRIQDYQLRIIEGPLVLVTYEKWEQIRGETQGRQCTVLFRHRHGLPHGVEWFHIHESWLTPEP